MKNLYWLSMVFMTFLLCSCTLLSPAPADSKTTYVLNKVPSVPIKHKKRNIVLFVTEPSTTSAYKTKQIAYSRVPYQIAYFAKNTWVSNPSDMLQPLMIQTLQNTHYFRAVIGQSMLGGYSYILNTSIEELLQDYTHQIPLLRLTIRASLVRVSTAKVIATKQIIITEPILQKTPYGGVYAANLATAEMLQQLSQFCLINI